MHTVVLSRSNIVGDDNNRLVYDIIGSKGMEGADIALEYLAMYYSWYNISSTLANNTFSIVIPALLDTDTTPTATSQTTISITIPDGLYEVSDIQAYLEQWSIENDFYLINSTTGEYKYFFQMQVNPTRYALQFNSYAIPTVSNYTGYTLPTNGFLNTALSLGSGISAFATTNVAVGWYFPVDFYKFAGFKQAIYKNSSATTSTPGYFTTTAAFPTGSSSFLSDTAPDVQPNSVIYLNCNLISNSYGNPTSFMYPITNDAAVGALLKVQPSSFAWNKITPGVSSQIVMTFTDKDGRPLKILDPNIVITLVIRDHSDKVVSMGPSVSGAQSASMETQRMMRHPAHHNSDTPHNNHMRMAHAKTMY